MKVKFLVKAYLEGLMPIDEALRPAQFQGLRLGKFVVKPTLPELATNFPIWYLAETEFEYEYKAEGIPISFEPAEQKINVLITALRLFKNGYVGAFPVVIEARYENLETPIRITKGISCMRKPASLAYGISQSETEKLEQFATNAMPILDKINSLREPAFLFFNRGVCSEGMGDHEMALVDFMSSLESALLSDSRELAHTLCERAAVLDALVGKRPAEEYERCKDLYDTRSKIIHGSGAGRWQGLASYKYSEAEGMARLALRVLLGYLSVKPSMEAAKEGLIDDIKKVIFGEADSLPRHAVAFVKAP